MVYGYYSNSDPMNLKKERNVRNSIKCHYNCGGYALGTFSWYCPHSEEYRGWYDPYAEESIESQVLAHVEIMLREFSNLRKISSLSEAKDDEEVIAFRLAKTDFHFMVRKTNKKWYHKRGSCNNIETITEEEVFSDCWFPGYWSPGYDSPIALMAMKKD